LIVCCIPCSCHVPSLLSALTSTVRCISSSSPPSPRSLAIPPIFCPAPISVVCHTASQPRRVGWPPALSLSTRQNKSDDRHGSRLQSAAFFHSDCSLPPCLLELSLCLYTTTLSSIDIKSSISLLSSSYASSTIVDAGHRLNLLHHHLRRSMLHPQLSMPHIDQICYIVTFVILCAHPQLSMLGMSD
jgi:hypothetical protein